MKVKYHFKLYSHYAKTLLYFISGFLFVASAYSQNIYEPIQTINLFEEVGPEYQSDEDPTCNYLLFEMSNYDRKNRLIIFKKENNRYEKIYNEEIDHSISGGIAVSDNLETIVFGVGGFSDTSYIYSKSVIDNKETWSITGGIDHKEYGGGFFVESISPDGKYLALDQHSSRENGNESFTVLKKENGRFRFERIINTSFEGRITNRFEFIHNQALVTSKSNGLKELLIYNLDNGLLTQKIENVNGAPIESFDFNENHLVVTSNSLSTDDTNAFAIYGKRENEWELEYNSSDNTTAISLGVNNLLFVDSLNILEIITSSQPEDIEFRNLSFQNGQWKDDGSFRLKGSQRIVGIPKWCDNLIQEYAIADTLSYKEIINFYEPEEQQDDHSLYDANPKYLPASIDDITKINDVKILDSLLKKNIIGVTADGESSAVLSFSFEEEVMDIETSIPDKYGKIEWIWGKRSTAISNTHKAFALYTPPDIFPEEGDDRLQGIDVFNLQLDLDVNYANSTRTAEIQHVFPLLRPPVVLVHGTFDNPEDCWKTGVSESDNGLFHDLEREGFKVFICDYSSTNGDQNFGTCDLEESEFFDDSNVNDRISSFECNKKVVYENPGGIKEAINHYRDTLNVACTQVDAIGHSMGGVLLRVYASDRVTEGIRSYETNYFRRDNYKKGDINRLITMASTHHGSDLAWLVNEIAKSSSALEEFKLFFTRMNNPIAAAIWMYFENTLTGAVIDQVPQSPALHKIGPTKIPSHAMTFYIDEVEELKNDPADTDQIYYTKLYQIGMILYFMESLTDKILTNIAIEWNRLPQHLKELENRFYNSYSIDDLEPLANNIEKFKELYKAPLESNFDILYSLNNGFVNSNIPQYESNVTSLLKYNSVESSINDFDNDEHLNFINKRVDLIKGEYNVSSTQRDHEVLDELMNTYRFLVFKNDWNDGTVRYLSQTGSLEGPNYVSQFAKHLHSFAPRYSDSKMKVISLLKDGMKGFNKEGFPNAGRKLPIWLPDMNAFSLPDITGCEAACWSGMVPDHALAWGSIADKENVIILNRPVNPDATPLIKDNASTKGMNLKGKSSDWGPQKGHITVDQRFSKIWSLYVDTTRDNEIIKFNKKVDKLIKDHPEVAIKRQLEKKYDCISPNTTYIAWKTKPKDDARAEIRFTSKSNPSIVYTWVDNDQCELALCETDCSIAQLDTLHVLANPDPAIAAKNGGVSPVYTADYDLLAIGFFDAEQFNNPEYAYPRPTYSPPEDYFDCEIGVMFPNQQELLSKLNEAVENLNYTGGNVAHHGPENQFTNMSFTNFPCDDSITNLMITANPYFDYPITAFEPDKIRGNSAGIVRSIQMGPPGYKDINLKRYIAEKRRQGFQIIANPDSPSWQWEYWRPYNYVSGYDDRDYPGMPLYPEQLPRLDLQECIDKFGCLNTESRIETVHQVLDKSKMRFKATDKLKVYPNPVINEPIQVVFKSEDNFQGLLHLYGPLGNTVRAYKIKINEGFNHFTLDSQYLNSGHYYLKLTSEVNSYSQKIIIQK